MQTLEHLEPQKVFAFFEEITKIPHGSGNVERISDFLVDFAQKRNLRVIQDEWKNVIIFQDATSGYENEPTLILQGHMDMVAVKTPDCGKDMKTEGLQVGIDGDNIYAEGTSLGGDDGIAIAYGLAILDSPEIRHPALELIFTVDEEVGMDGAREIDLSMLKGNRLLNLDSEEEGIFLTSCAGGARVTCRRPVVWQQIKMPTGKRAGETEEENLGLRRCRFAIDGLMGGHSGEEIDKGRGNSNLLFGRVLRTLCLQLPVQLVSAEGGLADNAIPRKTEADILIKDGDCEKAEKILAECNRQIQAELGKKDPDFVLRYEFDGQESDDTESDEVETEKHCLSALSVDDTRRVAAFLVSLPNGVQAMSADIDGLVETSLNLGILRLTEEGLIAEFSVRSSVESAKEALIDRLFAVTELAGGSNEVSGAYPGWKYREDSPLREKMIRVYREMYGKEPKVEAIHAGLECGLLGSKIDNLDCVSIGPDMKAIHTTNETLSISSTKRVWEYLVRLLETKEKDKK